MGLVRTILVLVILLILTHVALMYAGVGPGTNVLTNAVYSLGALLESPAAVPAPIDNGPAKLPRPK